MIRLRIPVALVVIFEALVGVVLVLILLVGTLVEGFLTDSIILLVQILEAFLAKEVRPRFVLFTVIFEVSEEVLVVFEGLEALPNPILHLFILKFDPIFSFWSAILLGTPVLVGILIFEFSGIGGVTKKESIIFFPHFWVRNNGVSLSYFFEKLLRFLNLLFRFSLQRVRVILFGKFIVLSLNLLNIRTSRHIQELVKARFRLSERCLPGGEVAGGGSGS